MIDALVFSKDRACQLDLLLRSIDRYASSIYGSLSVLYTASSAEFMRGYAVCFAEHARAKFVLEHDFEAQTRKWLTLANGPVSFLVDDDVFYRDASLPERLPWSYRGGDYDYPFSVDGNVYERDDAILALHDITFRNPTQLEAAAHALSARLPFRTVHHGRPCLVGVPANRVSASSNMPHMGYDVRELNDAYLRGNRLRFPEQSDDLPAHAAIEYGWMWEYVGPLHTRVYG